MPSFHYKVGFEDVMSFVIVHKKTFMDFYYIINMCEMLNFFPSMIEKVL